MKGIEPSFSAWEAVALPLSYTRNLANGVETELENRKTDRYLVDNYCVIIGLVASSCKATAANF